MRLLRRAPSWVPTPFPRLDGSTWPDRARASFAASALYSLVGQEAFTGEAHDVADVVLEEVLPLLDTGAAPADEAHMAQVCSAAAQVGAAVGLVERRASDPPEGLTGRDAVAVLWLASDDLPAMPAQQRDVARYLLQCGYFLARTDRERVWELTGALLTERHPALRPPAPGPEAGAPPEAGG